MRLIVALPVLLAVALNAAFVLGAARLHEAEAQLQRIHAAKAAVHGVVADLSQAEAGLGAYMATRDAGFLESFERTGERLSTRTAHLEETLSDPDGAADLLNGLLATSRAHLDVLSRMRDHVRSGGGEVPRELIAASRRERQRVNATAARIIFREDEILNQSESSARVLRMWVVAAAVAGALAGLACGAIASILLSSRQASRAPRRTARAAGAPATVPPPPSIPPDPKASVLIVDDDRHIRELLQRWLTPCGFELRQAPDAQAALAVIAEQPPTVVLCDIHMPGRDGLWLAERVRGIAPACAIVLATADDGVSPFESFKNGVVAYVLKPFRREELVAAVQKGVRWSAAEAGKAAAPARAPLL